jgi:hypothetical protein
VRSAKAATSGPKTREGGVNSALSCNKLTIYAATPAVILWKVELTTSPF